MTPSSSPPRSSWRPGSCKEKASALQYLRLAYETSPEAVRYVPSGRALAVDLARTTAGALSYTARQLAEDIGVAA